jgi:hypothetical protein
MNVEQVIAWVRENPEEGVKLTDELDGRLVDAWSIDEHVAQAALYEAADVPRIRERVLRTLAASAGVMDSILLCTRSYTFARTVTTRGSKILAAGVQMDHGGKLLAIVFRDLPDCPRVQVVSLDVGMAWCDEQLTKNGLILRAYGGL